jgi:hypothetical protein
VIALPRRNGMVRDPPAEPGAAMLGKYFAERLFAIGEDRADVAVDE